MTTTHRRHLARATPSALRAAAALAAAAVIAAGCGGNGGSDGEGDGDAKPKAGAIEHVDGTLAVDGDALTVTTADGEVTELTTGPALERGAAEGLAASGGPARVFYSAGDGDELLATSVTSAPSALEGTTKVEGQVVRVSSTEIVIETTDGREESYAIEPGNEASFDVPHLEEHRDQGEPVAVYLAPSAGDEPPTALAYEDA